MKPIENWENVKPVGGESVQLPAGGYVCKIIGAKIVVNRSGREMLEVGVDISTGEYAGFYRQKWDSLTNKDKKWPNAAMIRINLPDKEKDTPEDYVKKAGRVKKFIQDVEESNTPYVFKWDESTFKGKFVGCLFGREEFETQDGKKAWSTKLFYTTTIANIQTGSFKVPADRPLREEVSYHEPVQTDFSPIPDDLGDDLPF